MTSARRLDHLVLPSHDLEAQAAFYGRLGFQVGVRNVHPWGTENRLVQFDGCFLELITLGSAAAPPEPAPGRFSFGAHVRDRLKNEGDGMSMLAFDSPDAADDARRLNQAGISQFEPFHFGRKGRRPDGSEIEVAFSLAFATPPIAPALCFFFCQQHFPENFWNSTYQKHENTVRGVRRVVAIHDDSGAAGAFVKAFAGGAPRFDTDGATLETKGGALSFWSPAAAADAFGDDPALAVGPCGRFGAIVFEVESLAACKAAIMKSGVPHRGFGGRLVVPSEAAFGVLLAFEEAKQRS